MRPSYEMRMSDCSSDVCSSDLALEPTVGIQQVVPPRISFRWASLRFVGKHSTEQFGAPLVGVAAIGREVARLVEPEPRIEPSPCGIEAIGRAACRENGC